MLVRNEARNMKTVSLELARQLKEAKYPQEEGVRWYNRYVGNYPEKFKKYGYTEWQLLDWQKGGSEWETVVTPTTDEILDQLPSGIEIETEKKEYYIRYSDLEHANLPGIREAILADAIAKMWLYLKEKSLLPAE